MDTTTAASIAGRTVATIRYWCRYGAVAAVKTSGRWDVNETSLRYRLTIGGHMSTYEVHEITKTSYRGETSTAYGVVRSDGTPAGYGAGADSRIYGAVYMRRADAQVHRDFVEGTPAGYHIKRDSHPARSIKAGLRYWRAYGSHREDPEDFSHTWDDDREVTGDHWPAGTRPVDVLIALAGRHAAGREARIAKKAEADAVAAAEATVREAREARLAELRRHKGALATERQVDYIMTLIAQREYDGNGAGFFSGPTDRAGVEELSRREASMYIDSLREHY